MSALIGLLLAALFGGVVAAFVPFIMIAIAFGGWYE